MFNKNLYLISLFYTVIAFINPSSAQDSIKSGAKPESKPESSAIELLDGKTINEIKTQSDTVEIFKRLAQKYDTVSVDLKKWIDSQLEGKRANNSVGSDMTNLWESYKKSASYTKMWLADYGRVWVYDAALGLYAALCINDFKTAKLAMDDFINLIRAEKKKGFKGLFHFSYNTRGDDFIDPREPQGATQWALKAMYAYMLQSGDLTYFDELTGYLRNDIFPLQILDKDHPAFGFLRAGYMHPEGLSQGGYNIYYEIDSLNSLSHNVAMEHNADFIDLLRIVTLVYDKYNSRLKSVNINFRDELRFRHALCMQAALRWNKDGYWPTGFDELGNPNWSKAVDHYSWLGGTFMGLGDVQGIAWKSVQILYNEFSTTVDSIKLLYGKKEVSVKLAQPAKGSIFFDKSFADQFVDISQKEREKLAVMIQPEATAGVIVALSDFALHTKNMYHRQFAVKYIDELLHGLATIHRTYNSQDGYKGGGMPYATEFIEGYFGPDPSMAATATYFIALNKLKTGYSYFIGAPLPDGFANALADSVNLYRLPPAIPLPDYVRQNLENKRTGKKTSILPEDIANRIEPADFKIEDGQIHISLSYPAEYFHNLELIIMSKTDKWYVQPRSIYDSRAGQDLPQPAKNTLIRCFNKKLEPSNTVALIARRGTDLKSDSMLSDFEMEQYFLDGYFIKGLFSGTKTITRDNLQELHK